MAASATPPQGSADKTIEELRFDYEYAKKNLEAAQAEWEKVPHVGIGDAGYREYERLSEAFEKRIKKLYEETVFTGTRLRNAELGIAGPKTGEGVSGVVVQKDAEGKTVYSGEGLPSGTTTRERMPEQKAWLADAVKQAAAEAPKADFAVRSKKFPDVAREVGTAFPERVRFQIPGDGAFTVPNEKHAIEAFGKDIGATLSPAGLNAPKGGGKPSGRGLARVDKSAPPTFTSDAADKLLSPFAPKSQYDTIKQRTGNTIAYGTREMIAFVRGIPGAKDNKWKAAADLSKIADFRDDLPDGRDAVSADVPTLLRDVREAGALVDTSKEMLEVPSEQKAREAAYARNFKYEGPGTVRLMQGADGKLFIAGEAADGSTVETGDMKGAREIGMFNPDYLENALDLMARTGSGKVFIGTGTPNKSGLAPFVLRGEKGNAAVVLMPKVMPKAEGAAPAAPASAPRGGVRADVAAETPRLAGTARPTTAGTKPATPDGPREALRQELKVMMDAGATGAELDAFAARAEAADAFATAALARQAAGTYRGTPWGTEGGNWPHEEPPAARASMGDLFMLARSLGDGSSPGVVRRIARLLGGRAAGVFRGTENDPDSGSVQITSGLFGLVDARERAAIRDRAQAEAERTGEDFADVHDRMLRRAIRENAYAGPKRAMAVLAHEIGHWVDFLDEGTLKRGNVLGHLAALKKWAGHQIFPSKAAADAAGAPGVTDAIVKARAEEWGVSQAEARRRLTEGADLQALPDLRREMESLVAWYRQSDGAPDYFRNDPAELYAEAFSAWVNYPAETARRAPAFASTMDGWLDARPKAAAALREFRDGVTQAEARAAKAAGDTTNPAFFAALDQDQAAARRAEELAGRLTDKALAERSFGGMAEDAHARIKVALTGADDILKGELMRSPLGAFNAHNLPLWRSMQQKDNANNRMVLWDYRYRTFVEPLLSGVPRPTFLNFLYHSRVAHELLGPDATRGRMNLPNADGLTPGDITRAEGNAQTSSAAWLNELRRTQPEIYEKCERARREFWNKVRNGGDELGGEGSPMDVIRNSPCLSAEQKAALLGNEWYVAFRPAMVPDVSRPVASGEMSVWDGIFSQRTGSEKPVGDVLANTLLQDLTMQDQLLRQEYRLRAVDWLRANKAEWVGAPAAVTVDPATGRRSVAQREKPGWRVVAFLRGGKPEGWWVRDFVADALAPKPHQRTSAEPFRNALNASARGINALKTTLNPAFGVANTLKDAFSIALRQLPRDTSGLGHAQALLAGVQNWLGDYGAMMRSFRDNSAADLVRGRWNADTARALAWGALNNAAPNQSAYAGGGERGGVGDIAARYREEGRSEISDADLRRAMKTFGYTERQISDALDRTEGPLARALREAGRVTGARWLAERHGDLMAFLSRGEIRTKSFALAEALRRRPDLTREELVQWTHDMIGTPAMNNRPTVAKIPGIGHLVPFLTPRVHGWTDQLFGALRTGWTGGPGRSAQVASRIAFTTAMMSIPLAAVGILRGEAEEAEEAGDGERADELRRMARRWQAIPSSDILSGICFPDPTSATRHVKIPVDPTIIPMAGLALEAIFGGKDLPKGAGAERFTGDLLPTMGTAPTLVLGNKTGVDPNTGRAVIGERTPGLDRALWNWDQLTARGLGMLPGSMLRAWMVGQEDAREIEKAGRADKTPVVSALWRPFLRRSGYGLVERAGAMRDADAADSRRATSIAERVVQGREVPADDLEWFGANVASPGESLRAAALRMQRLRTMAPDERAAAALPVRRRERIEREAGYIAPPRLTDEDRNR